MGRGGNAAEWKTKVVTAYQEWKYNDLHKNIKAYFTEVKSRDNLPESLIQKIREESPVLHDLAQLREVVEKEEREETQKLFVRDSDENITFLGTKIEVPIDVADDEDVSWIKPL